MRVLLADDSELIRKRLENVVCAYKQVDLVGSYENGTAALKALKTLKPDLAILDIQMPGYTGLEVLQEIRKENKTMKIVILTLYSSGFYRSISFKEGADYFFSKADDFEKIPVVIEELISNENKEKRASTKKPENLPLTKNK
jgi:DNA-binding NarL/FixJ family response regulator